MLKSKNLSSYVGFQTALISSRILSLFSGLPTEAGSFDVAFIISQCYISGAASLGRVFNQNEILARMGSSEEEITHPRLDFVKVKWERKRSLEFFCFVFFSRKR